MKLRRGHSIGRISDALREKARGARDMRDDDPRSNENDNEK